MIQSTTFETENIGLKIGNYEINLTVITNLDDLFDALISKGKDHEDVQDRREVTEYLGAPDQPRKKRGSRVKGAQTPYQVIRRIDNK